MIDPVAIGVGTLVGTTVASAVKGAKGPAQAIDDIMQLVGFGKLNERANRSRIHQQQSENDYKIQIAGEIDKIPEEHLQDPQLSIIGPALEASKYYVEEEDLRTMFSKIVASALDSRNNMTIHQSFVEIIKQLSTLDAKHLKQIFYSQVNPLIHVSYKNPSGGSNLVADNLFMSNHLDLSNYELISDSLVNLKRLGLIEIPKDTFYTTETHYSTLENSSTVKRLKSRRNHEYTLSIDRGVINMTSFGKNFCKVCL